MGDRDREREKRGGIGRMREREKANTKQYQRQMGKDTTALKPSSLRQGPGSNLGCAHDKAGIPSRCVI